MTSVIHTERLTKRYGEQRGIDDVSLDVEAGEVYGFLGPNGAGKTTTIRTLLGLLHPTSGSARVFGLDTETDSPAIRARLGNLPGDFSYEPRLTGRELVEHFARLRGIRGEGRALEVAERFHADLERPLGELSHGNRQKIGLVQALFHEPELLVLDEPTGGLDPLMQAQFLELLEEERERGATVFLSSHDLDEVQRVCDRVGIIREGRLIAVERVSDLMRRSYRHVAIEFETAPAAEEFARLPGVYDLTAAGERLAFRAEGDLDAVVKAAARHTVRDIEVSQPTLDEIFLTYYGGEAAR